MSNSSLATIQVPAYSGNYTRGRGRRKIQKITIHHMAGRLTAQQCGAIFQKIGRKGSTHYGIGYNGEIAQYVDEANTAWADSNWTSNQISVTFETSNSSTGGQWPVSDVTLASVIKLCADIAIRNNLGPLVPGENLTWHSMYSSTACPGPYLKSKMGDIAAEANKIIAQDKINQEPPTQQPDDFVRIYKKSLGYSSNGLNFNYLDDAKNYVKSQYLINNITYSIKEKIKTTTTTYEYTWNNDKGYYEPKVKEETEIETEEVVQFDVEVYTYIENPDNPKNSTTSILLNQFKGGNGE